MGFTIETGTKAPDFNLPGVDGRNHTLSEYAGAKILIVFFSCNHCPYVVNSEERMIAFQHEFESRGIQMVAINSNETDNHPADSFEKMIEHAKEVGLNFPYLRDESQEIAKAYGALRTPHYYVFDEKRILRYNGRMDDSPRDVTKVSTHELRDAVEAMLAGSPVANPVTLPIGCNVKWRGREEHWVPADACDFV